MKSLVRSPKFNSLPADLKKIGQELFDKKFGQWSPQEIFLDQRLIPLKPSVSPATVDYTLQPGDAVELISLADGGTEFGAFAGMQGTVIARNGPESNIFTVDFPNFKCPYQAAYIARRSSLRKVV